MITTKRSRPLQRMQKQNKSEHNPIIKTTTTEAKGAKIYHESQRD